MPSHIGLRNLNIPDQDGERLFNLSTGFGLLPFGYLSSSALGKTNASRSWGDGGTYTAERCEAYAGDSALRTLARMGKLARWSSSTDDQFWPTLTAASRRMKPGGRPCFERISSQPLLESTTLSFVPGPMLAICGEFSLGPP